jgi:hypothetical protein
VKPIKKTINLVPSETVTQQLDELCRITQMTPRAIVEDVVAFELANMFAGTDDPPAATVRSLQSYLYRHDYSREDATKIAADYNAFVIKEAQRAGRPATHAAVVSSNPNEHGFFRIWFPLLASRVQKIALEARQALKAANVAVATP